MLVSSEKITFVGLKVKKSPFEESFYYITSNAFVVGSSYKCSNEDNISVKSQCE